MRRNNKIVSLGEEIAAKRRELAALEAELDIEVRRYSGGHAKAPQAVVTPPRPADPEEVLLSDAIIAGKVVPLLDREPDRVFTVDDITRLTGVPRHLLVMSIGRMVRWHKVHKVEAGKYKASTVKKAMEG
ncbi:MAG: hypothetical protein AAB074_15750 [Planctomycetota bacterium]